MAGTALASDETGMRVGKANWWLWVFHHRDSAVFVADNHRSKADRRGFSGRMCPDLGIGPLRRPDGFGQLEHQVVLRIASATSKTSSTPLTWCSPRA